MSDIRVMEEILESKMNRDFLIACRPDLGLQ